MRILTFVALTGVALCCAAACSQTTVTKSAQSSSKEMVVANERSLNAAEKAHVAQLDRLLAAGDNDALVRAALQPGSSNLLFTTLDWGKARLLNGSGLTVGLVYARALWRVGLMTKNTEMLDSSSLITLYNLLVMHADGVKCADQTAVTNRLQGITAGYYEQVVHLKNVPPIDGMSVGTVAMEMERKLAPKRGNDNYLCRGGMQEYVDYLKAHPDADKGAQTVPGQVGRTVVIPNDPAYEPAFLPMGEWGPKQFLAREKFPEIVRKLTAATL